MDEALTEFQQSQLCQIIQVGCDRATAGKYCGMTAEQLQRALDRDEEFARRVLRAEAEAALRHMGNIHKAASDEKNWRTSVWWLEQMAPGAVDAADASAADFPQQVLTALERFAAIIVAEIPDLVRRQSILLQLLHIAAESVEVGQEQKELAPASLLLPAPEQVAGEGQA